MTTIESYVQPREIPVTLDLPPGPKLPPLLQTVLFLGMRTYVAPRWQRRYGDVFSVHVAPAGRGIVITKPEHIREVFAGTPDVFHAGEGNAILGPVMGEHSVLLLDEDAHRESRRKVMAAFHGEAMRHWAGVVEDLAAADVGGWPVGVPFPVHPQLNDISLEVILRIVFGVTDADRLAALRPLLRRLVQIGPMIFVGWMHPALQHVGPWRRFLRLKDRVDELVYAEIAERRSVPDLAERRDVLSKLLVADPEQTDEELRDHLITLLLAGHETTASTLAWTFHDLARRPELLGKVQRAADEGDDDYLEATIKEAMRLRPVIGSVARRLAKPATVAGYDLPPGVVIFPSILLVHRREEVFDDASAFRPERFLGQNPPPATWIPFGGGIRRCLGASLAMVESVAVLKTVLRLVDIAPAGPQEMSKTRNITTVPARGARIVAFPR
jgi:cytochrome P450 family 135